MSDIKKGSTVKAIATIGIGASICYVMVKYHGKFFQKLISLHKYIRNPLRNQTIKVINTIDECKLIVKQLRTHCNEFNVLGFDCEWITVGGQRRPVALLQLSSHKGLCALIRVCNLKQIPLELRELLEDDNVIKVGIVPRDDAKKLSSDYGVGIASTMDLRFVASYIGSKPEGLAKMSKTHLNIELDKNWRISCSNWESKQLTETQIKYAANDAHVAIELFKVFMKQIKKRFLCNRKQHLQDVLSVCNKYIDLDFITGIQTNFKPNETKQKVHNMSKRFFSTRSKPLYENCLLEAPDGELLCTIDRKKAAWYVSKNIGQQISESPYTVRLNFEPSGRSVGEVGKYYQQEKLNHCVVCGNNDSYIRKNVVPREYRKYFPLIMKSHTSHDILLLCAKCHQISSTSDIVIRNQLANLCNAPYSIGKAMEEPKLKKIKSIARAILNHTNIPQQRIDELKSNLLHFYPDHKEITNVLLEEAANLNIMIENTDYSHGRKVVEHFTNNLGGLIELELIWRQHFLKVMKPKFLPKLWSVNHNSERMTIRLNEGRISDDDVKIAGLKITEDEKELDRLTILSSKLKNDNVICNKNIDREKTDGYDSDDTNSLVSQPSSTTNLSDDNGG